MDLRDGYKQTEVGLIPADWTLRPLGSIGKWFSGGTPTMSIEEYWSGDIPWVSPKDMKVPRLHDSIDHITPQAVADGARLLPAGAILVVIRGMILAHSFPVARAEGTLAFNQDIKAVVAGDGVDSNFLLYWLTANEQRLRSLATESTHGTKRLPTEMLFRELVTCPPMLEQETIAKALSDADALIESLEQLLAKKRQIRQGAVQELLSGTTRLPGYAEEWEVKRLGDICHMKSGESITGEHIDDHSEFPCYGGNGLRGFSKRWTHDGRYALIGRQGALCGNVLTVTGQFFASEHAVVVTPHRSTDIDWLSRILKEMNLNQYSESSAQPGLSVTKLLALECMVPPLPEQFAIATVLSDMDCEIGALDANLAKDRQLKQGMMQALLTGMIRLV